MSCQRLERHVFASGETHDNDSYDKEQNTVQARLGSFQHLLFELRLSTAQPCITNGVCMSIALVEADDYRFANQLWRILM